MPFNRGSRADDVDGNAIPAQALLNAVCNAAEQELMPARAGGRTHLLWWHELNLPLATVPVSDSSNNTFSLALPAALPVAVAEQWEVLRESCTNPNSEQELVLGIGYCSAVVAPVYSSHRHLLTIKLDLISESNGSFRLHLKPNTPAELNLAAFSLNSPAVFSPLDWNPLDPQAFESSAASLLAEHGIQAEYSPELQPDPSSAALKISFAPALISRPKWAARCLRWAQSAASPREVPTAWTYLQTGASVPPQAANNFTAGALPYSPLPAEDDLFAAASSPILHIHGVRNDWLACAINLLCWHLSQQHRVLLTASNAELLQTLAAKLAPALKALQASNSDSSQKSPTINDVLQQLDRELQNLQRIQKQTSAALIAQIQSESQLVTIAGLQGTPLSIGQFVEQSQARDGWLGDALSDFSELPLSTTELEELRSWWAIADESATHIRESSGALEQLRQLPNVSLVRNQVAEWQQQRQAVQAEGQKLSQGSLAPLATAKINAAQVAPVVPKVREAARSLRRLPAKLAGWVQRAVNEIREGNKDWQSRKGKIDRAITLLQPILTEIDGRSIEVTVVKDHKHLREQLLEIIQYLEKGGSLSWWRPIAKWKVFGWRTVAQQVRIDNKPCYGLVELRLILKWLEFKQYLASVWLDWEGIAQPQSDALQDQQGELLALQKTLGGLLSALEPFTVAADLVRGLNVEKLTLPASTDPAQLEAFAVGLEAYVARARQAGVPHPFEKPMQVLGQIATRFPASSLLRQVVAALKNCDVPAYEHVLQQVAVQDQQQKLRQRGIELGNRLAAKMPGFAHQLQATASEEIWKTRLPAIRSAWVWSQAYRWLREFSAKKDDTQALHRRYAEISQAISQAVIQRTAAIALVAADHDEERAGCQQLIRGCCWLGSPSAGIIENSQHDLPFDVILLLTDRGALPAEIMLLDQTKQLVVLERTDRVAAVSSPANELGAWQELLLPAQVPLQIIPALDPSALSTIPRLNDGNEKASSTSRFRSDVAQMLSKRGFSLRHPVLDHDLAWTPNYVIADLAAPFVVQCYDNSPCSTDSLLRGFHEQMRWQQAGWQVGYLYASEFYAQGESAIQSLLGRTLPTFSARTVDQRAAKVADQRATAGEAAPSDAAPANARWRRLIQLGAQLQFNRQNQLVIADFRHTFATLSDLSALTDCPGLHTVHFPFHTSDDTLRQLNWLPQLTGLNLSFSRITNRGLKTLESLTKLRWLGLCGARVSDQGMHSLIPLHSLETLDLRMTRVSERARLEFEEHCPECKVQSSTIRQPVKTTKANAPRV